MLRRLLLCAFAVLMCSAFSFADGLPPGDPQIDIRGCGGSNALVFGSGNQLFDNTAQTSFLFASSPGAGEVCYSNTTGQTLTSVDITANQSGIGALSLDMFGCTGLGSGFSTFFTNCTFDKPVGDTITFHFFGTDQNHFGILPFLPCTVVADVACNHSQSEFAISQLGFDDATFTGAANTSEVPEPATLALLGSGLAGAAWRRRRRKN